MEHLVVELSKYIIIVLITMYTLHCFTVFRNKNRKRQSRIFDKQIILMYTIHFICYLILFLHAKNVKVVMLYLCEVIFFSIIRMVYQKVYKNLSKLVLNNMLMLLMISFVMLTRLSYNSAVRQFVFAAGSMALCLIVPFVIEKMKELEKFGWLFAVLGILALAVVLVFGRSKYGAKNWFTLFGIITIQPSEFVKILFVFFIGALLAKTSEFKQVIKVSVLAGAHVLLLVLEKDLGGALIFFVTYLVMLFVATRQTLYFLAGLAGGSGAACIAYRLFDHVKVRVSVWQNPWRVIDGKGYQIAQSLFAIGTGGWFGLGLCEGLPTSIPVSTSDFIFSAIAEELGGITAVCIVLICLSCFIMFINIAMKMKSKFYKLSALGFGTLYGFQVFLTIGGATKLIPSTGVTLPLVSYGGSSIISTVIIFSVIQGLYVLNQNEDDQFEREKKSQERRYEE